MKKTLISVILLLSVICHAAAPGAVPTAFESQTSPTPPNKVDEVVFRQLKRLGIQPANACAEAVFVRRVYLDVIGTLPTGQEARDYLLDRNPNKRRILIDRLLERDEFADYWAMKWSDLLRIKAEFPINLWPNAAQAYHRWIRTAIKENLPYDKFVRDMLTANGSNFRVGPVNFYRSVQNRSADGIAQGVALTFMGTRADKWPKERLSGMGAFFSQIGYKPTREWKEEVVFWDPTGTAPIISGAPPKAGTNVVAQPAVKGPTEAVFPDGTRVRLLPERDPREIFADWLISAKNPWFGRSIVNRMWSWLLGRGIIHEPDDIRPDNPPSNPELLALLEKELVAAKYDLKQIFRLILNSQTYQLSSIPKTDTSQAQANFAHYPVRRLEAEVLIDAVNTLTGTTEKYSSPIPEPFTFIPEGQRAISLPDGSITSSFLEQFGRPTRDTGYESERNNRITPSQRLHLLNSSHFQRKMEQSEKFKALMQSKTGNPRDVVAGIYLFILSRFPTPDELRIVGDYFQAGGSKGGREATMDLAWALINSAEFLYRH